MAEIITIPSPSIFLSIPSPSIFLSNSSDPSSAHSHDHTHTPAKKSPVRRTHQPSQKKDDIKLSDANGVTKRKQSKSRNGCITCKAKRLKCDETKPTCQQCTKRNVQCGGYKKDFKWRAFEEGTFTGKPPGKSRKDASPQPPTPIAHMEMPMPNTFFHVPPSPASFIMHPHPHPHPTTPAFDPHYPPISDPYAIPHSAPYSMPPLSPSIDQFRPASVETPNTIFEAGSIDTRHSRTTAASSVSPGQSPALKDLLLPGTDLSVPPEEYYEYRAQFPDSFYQPTGYTPPPESIADDDDIEEIPRDFATTHEQWAMRLPSPDQSSPSTSPDSSPDSSRMTIYSQPIFGLSSPEMLTRRFDRQTCGILSVKDGPTENPWRTLVWPLARDCPALYHAISSMTSFHGSRDVPLLRIQGIDHMRSSISALRESLENMRVDAAISTTLVLAFSESWDQHISTGINHIKGAKLLIDKAISEHNQAPLQGEDYTRLKFLCNSWLYMDVIARLTSDDDDESNDFDIVPDAIYMNNQADTQLDPLMGCASTLFPIIGRVANLVRKVRKTDRNGPKIISQAVELRAQLEAWEPPSGIEDPEDESTKPESSRKTAEAYRFATLLYLHQAVPEAPSRPSAALSKDALCALAAVEPQSRSVIVHIYPLMAAGCEATEPEEREWVQERWEMLSQRMKLGIIEKCVDVTKEVWARRDAQTAAENEMAENELMEYFNDENYIAVTPSLKRDFDAISEDINPSGDFCWLDTSNKRRAVSNGDLFGTPQPLVITMDRNEGKRRSELQTELLAPEFTVKGRLHWLGVMKDWGWEVLLG